MTFVHLHLDAPDGLDLVADGLAPHLGVQPLDAVQVLVQLDDLVVHRVEAQVQRLLTQEEALRDEAVVPVWGRGRVRLGARDQHRLQVQT